MSTAGGLQALVDTVAAPMYTVTQMVQGKPGLYSVPHDDRCSVRVSGSARANLVVDQQVVVTAVVWVAPSFALVSSSDEGMNVFIRWPTPAPSGVALQGPEESGQHPGVGDPCTCCC